ncbi:MAG: hypothetical protein ACREO8_08675 [Luteimonas sp.]
MRDGVLFDHHNVLDTAKHCWTRNLFLQGRATVDGAAEALITEALQEIREGVVAGKLFSIYNAWCVVDAITPGTTGTIGGASLPDARWQANFFVRLGRQPELQAISDSR